MGRKALPVIKVNIPKRHFVDMITNVFDREYVEHRFELFREEINSTFARFKYDTSIIYGLQVVTFEIRFKRTIQKRSLSSLTKWLARNYDLADIDIWWEEEE